MTSCPRVAHELEIAKLRREAMANIEVVHVTATIQLEVLDLSQLGMRFDLLDQAITQAQASVLVAHDDIKDEGLEHEIGQHPGERDQLIAVIDDTDGQLRALQTLLGLCQGALFGPPGLAVKAEQLLGMVITELMNDVHMAYKLTHVACAHSKGQRHAPNTVRAPNKSITDRHQLPRDST
jgi:hypothetical protein